jgi:hypothetical protein
MAALAIAAWSSLLLAFAVRQPALIAFALIIFGAEYAVFLRLRGGTVDTRAPFVAAGLILVAEPAFHVVAGRGGRAEGKLVIRSLLLLLGVGAGAAIVGGVILVTTAYVRSGLAFEAVGVLAAALAVGAVVRIAVGRRSDAASG